MSEPTAGSSTARLALGRSYELRLPGAGSSGYRWRWDSASPTGAVRVEQLPGTDLGERPIAGWSADEVFRVTPLEYGTHVVHFLPRRPWETDAEPDAEHLLSLQVQRLLVEHRHHLAGTACLAA